MRKPDMPSGTAQQYVQLINTAARDAAAVIRRLRELYREHAESTPDATLDLGRCIEEATALTEPRWKSQALGRGVSIKIVHEVADVPVILGDAAGIREMLTNLIFNAVDAMPEGGTITMRARAEGDEVVLTSATPASACRKKSAAAASSRSSRPRTSRAPASACRWCRRRSSGIAAR
jgi:signal transduction histidine kinase